MEGLASCAERGLGSLREEATPEPHAALRATKQGDQPMSISSDAPIFTVGLDVHKDSVTAAVFQDRDR
jgi:hypothetical protein